MYCLEELLIVGLYMNLNPSTLQAVITDLIHSLEGQGILKIVLLNGHGGNELTPAIRELYGKTKAAIFLCNWYRVIDDVYHDIFVVPEDHAGEMETSFMMAFFPELVRRKEDGSLDADEGQTKTARFEAVNRKWVWITRPWHLLTSNSGSGNPLAATEVKGEQLVELLVERLAPFLVELSETKLDDTFPF